jgi:hypothetical protein
VEAGCQKMQLFMILQSCSTKLQNVVCLNFAKILFSNKVRSSSTVIEIRESGWKLYFSVMIWYRMSYYILDMTKYIKLYPTICTPNCTEITKVSYSQQYLDESFLEGQYCYNFTTKGNIISLVIWNQCMTWRI